MKKRLLTVFILTIMFVFCGCSQQTKTTDGHIKGLTYEKSMETKYATCFTADYYAEGHVAIHIDDGSKYLVVPQGANIPSSAKDYTIIQQPLQNTYLVATASMAFFDALDGMEAIRLSGTQQQDWYVENAAQAMAEGKIIYAGKYSAPDYELICDENCQLAIQSTMIYHSPEIKEKLEELGISVFVDRSSYEAHPLGRTEWIKVYGAMLGRDEAAEQWFDSQAQQVETLDSLPENDKTVAFFYVTSNGTVAVRKSNDYFASMIELAGGKYIFENLGDPESANSGVTMTMEEFYAATVDADYIIYNASTVETLETVDDLLEKSELFADYKAVKNGNVWCTDKSLYQSTDVLGSMIQEIHGILSGEQTDMQFFNKIS